MSAHGVLYVHSAPPALCPHVEWAVAGIVGAPVSMPWVGQPASPGALRAELSWQARPGTAGAIASALAIAVAAALVMFANSRGLPGRRAGIGGGHEAQYVGQSVPR